MDIICECGKSRSKRNPPLPIGKLSSDLTRWHLECEDGHRFHVTCREVDGKAVIVQEHGRMPCNVDH